MRMNGAVFQKRKEEEKEENNIYRREEACVWENRLLCNWCWTFAWRSTVAAACMSFHCRSIVVPLSFSNEIKREYVLARVSAHRKTLLRIIITINRKMMNKRYRERSEHRSRVFLFKFSIPFCIPVHCRCCWHSVFFFYFFFFFIFQEIKKFNLRILCWRHVQRVLWLRLSLSVILMYVMQWMKFPTNSPIMKKVVFASFPIFNFDSKLAYIFLLPVELILFCLLVDFRSYFLIWMQCRHIKHSCSYLSHHNHPINNLYYIDHLFVNNCVIGIRCQHNFRNVQ